jgi:hypothetical protein
VVVDVMNIAVAPVVEISKSPGVGEIEGYGLVREMGETANSRD